SRRAGSCPGSFLRNLRRRRGARRSERSSRSNRKQGALSTDFALSGVYDIRLSPPPVKLESSIEASFPRTQQSLRCAFRPPFRRGARLRHARAVLSQPRAERRAESKNERSRGDFGGSRGPSREEARSWSARAGFLCRQ